MVKEESKQLNCRHCERPLRGRIDKKFCDDRCRNQFNNQERSVNDQVSRMINAILGKNRRILKALYDARRFRVKKTTLEQLGFRADYHTHRKRVGRGKLCICYYDHGIISNVDESYKITRVTEMLARHHLKPPARSKAV